jgi:aminoglycoside 6'-N-acetyltransferase
MSARLTLRPLASGDGDQLAAIQRMPDVARWWGPVHDDDFIPGDPEVVQLTILIDDQIAGLIQYSEEDDPMYRNAGIDLFLDPSKHGQNYGREAIRLVAHHLIDVLGHHRLTIDPSATNTAAIRAYGAIGFKPVGILRQYERDVDGSGWHDGLLMDLLAAELK